MKLNETDEVWNSVNPLFNWCSGLLSSRNFASMATWRNDFSSLLAFWVVLRFWHVLKFLVLLVVTIIWRLKVKNEMRWIGWIIYCFWMELQMEVQYLTNLFNFFRHAMNLLLMWWIYWGSSPEHDPSPQRKLNVWWISSIVNSVLYRCSSSRAHVKLLWF